MQNNPNNNGNNNNSNQPPPFLPPINNFYLPPPMQNNYRPLNVKDALSYLDTVKLQFSNEPDVYNRFLDIMKDFKSQAIDTPGVIERVSKLFKGYPQLIIGFNTFLPPGYKIEITSDNKYTITTPQGTHQSQAAHSQSLQGTQGQAQPVQVPVVQEAKVEFNHAISYVNKIKSRFSHDPEVYKKFLEILRNYQSEQKPINVVYSQIQVLFNGQDDLLEEFKQFLPQTQGQSQAFGSSGTVNGNAGNLSANSSSSSAGANVNLGSHFQPYNAALQSTFPQQHAPPVPNNRVLKVKHASNRYMPSSTATWNVTQEFEFFDKVKKCLSNKQSYTEFLKVLNLFNQDLIDVDVLIEKVEPFISKNEELFEWFKSYVKQGDSQQGNGTGNNPSYSSATLNQKTLSNQKRSGSSYRLLPKDYQQPLSSGRDDIAKEVLNDEWVCHPTWASEDGGFIAHKKNQFEECLYRCEEERYEFDLWIESCKSVLMKLQVFYKEIEDSNQSEEEKRNVKMGESGSSIYKSVLKKIYDEERGRQVLECLFEHPYITIPVVLKRLKQKDEEWRRSQREWSKVWRELEGRNYYKALDHQGINFKTNEKKLLSSKYLIQEIESLYRSGVNPQYKFAGLRNLVMVNKKMLDGCFRLIKVYLLINNVGTDVVGGNYGNGAEEVNEILKFLEKFLNQMFATGGKTVIIGNGVYYLFFRYLELLHKRLSVFFEYFHPSKSFKSNGKVKENEVAKELDLTTVSKEMKKMASFDDLVSFIEKYVCNEIDPNVFEEELRFTFGKDAYLLFSADKLVHNLCRQLLTIVNDDKCQKLFELMVVYGSTGVEFVGKADEYIEEYENLYKIESKEDGFLCIAIENRIEANGANNSGNNNGGEVKWSEYLDEYVRSGDPDACCVGDNQLVFMKRTKGNPNDDVQVSNGLECKICMNSFRLFFVDGSEDLLWRRGKKKEYNSKKLQW